MDDNPTLSETIVEESAPAVPEDPASAFRKGKAKREAKRKEVKVITEYVPEPPVASTPLSAAVEVPNTESIAARVAEMLLEKMANEKVSMDKTPEAKKTRPRPTPPTQKTPSPPPPPTKYFGWC